MRESMAAVRMPAPILRWMAGRTRAERWIVLALLVMVAIVVLWSFVWQPIVRDSEALRAARGANSAALSAARAMTEEAAGLARASTTPAAPDPREGLERVLAQQNLRGAVTQLDWKDARAHLVFSAIGYDALIALLETLQRETGLRAVEAVVTARVEPGTVRAELTLAR
jgi:type II secretory pathway component PulM